ncbi:MAG: hypothetical protein KF812_10110 [Fimbriimonadaceae bacterium]|nr:hypothetical protein [Fimbriimonadaceae bacterium]
MAILIARLVDIWTWQSVQALIGEHYILFRSALAISQFPALWAILSIKRLDNPSVLHEAVQIKIDELASKSRQNVESATADISVLKARRSALRREETRSHSDPRLLEELRNKIDSLSTELAVIESEANEIELMSSEVIDRLKFLSNILSNPKILMDVAETSAVLDKASNALELTTANISARGEDTMLDGERILEAVTKLAILNDRASQRLIQGDASTIPLPNQSR